METKDFRDEIRRVLNCFSKENGSNTPDFILADYLCQCLDTFDKVLMLRGAWYGNSIPGKNEGSVAVPTNSIPPEPEKVEVKSDGIQHLQKCLHGEGEIVMRNSRMVCKICGALKDMPEHKEQPIDWEMLKVNIYNPSTREVATDQLIDIVKSLHSQLNSKDKGNGGK